MAELIQLGDFMTSGEEKVAETLRDHLPASWKVIANKVLTLPNGLTREIDFLVLGQHQLYVLDEKGTGGRIHGSDQYWILESGSTRANPLDKMEMVARNIAGQLRQNVPFLEENLGQLPFVQAGIIFSNPSVNFLIQEPRRNRIMRLDNCVETLKKLDQRGRDCSIEGYRNEILSRLNLLPPRPSLPRKIDAYHIQEELSGGPYYRAFLAKHDTGDIRLLKLYRLEGLNTAERDSQKKLIYRDYQALVQLASSLLVPGVDLPFTWADEQYMVVSQRLLELPSLRAFVGQDSLLSLEQRLRLGSSLLAGLAVLHSRDVLHRNLTPDNLFVEAKTKTMRFGFTDFDFARIPQQETIATMARSYFTESPYRAPELSVGLEFAEAASDIFAVGIILAELFTGKAADEMYEADGTLQIPLLPTDDPHISPNELSDLHDILEMMTHASSQDRLRTAQEAHDFIGLLLSRHEVRSATASAVSQVSPVGPQPLVNGNKEVSQRFPGAMYQKDEIIKGRYRVLRNLGSGATAYTYLVEDTEFGGQFVLKQLRDPQYGHSRVQTEFNALKNLASKGIVRVFEPFQADPDTFLKMEFVEGNSLHDLHRDFPWKTSKVIQVGCGVLETLVYLEKHNVAHRDISAKNLILTPDGLPKLIDFGFASAQGSGGNTTVGTVAYRTPELDRGAGWNATQKTGDTYAVGVLLYEILTGKPPFLSSVDGHMDKSAVPSIPEPVDPSPEAFCRTEVLKAILHAIQPTPAERYISASHFLESLKQAATAQPLSIDDAAGERIENDWVHHLQGLYRNSRTGNADNRGLDSDFARDTYVETKLDVELIPQILAGKYSIVLLSGNPGDGKTAFLERLSVLMADDGKTQQADSNGWHILFHGHHFAANYDASESNNGKRADELLDLILMPLQGDAAPNDSTYTALLAINDGKLREFLLDNPKYGWLGEQLRLLLEEPAKPIDRRIALVDLKQRSVVGISQEADESDLFARVLDKLLVADGWQECANCRARTLCPIKFNRDSLVDIEQGFHVRARLRSLFQITHLRRDRHITMRDMRSALSYIIAGTASCSDIHHDLETGQNTLQRYKRLYFVAAFNPESEGEENLKDFSLYDPATVPVPRLDRFLHFRRTSERYAEIEQSLFSFATRSKALLRDLNYTALGPLWYYAQKRRFFFESDPGSISKFDTDLPEWKAQLPYRHFNAFLDAVSRRTLPTKLRDDLCEAISRANGIVQPEQYRDYLCIRTTHNSTADLTVFKRFPREDFECDVAIPRTEQVETLPNYLRLHHIRGDATLNISLDLFEILMRFTEGYRPGIEEQQPFITDLMQFQNRLLNRPAIELLLLEGGRKLHRVRQQNGTIELIRDSTQSLRGNIR